MSDSFEEIIDDARLNACNHVRKLGIGYFAGVTCCGCAFAGSVSCDAKMRSDLVRRCKDVAASIGCNHVDSAGGSVSIGEVTTFPGAKADKAQALKVLEEAAEVFGAWQQFDDGESPSLSRWRVLAECADVIQATCNLLSGMGVADFTPYVAMCRTRNEERGRFDG